MYFESALAQQASHATTVAIVRMKAIAAFERHGTPVVKVDAMTLRTESGSYMGLHNLVERCAGVPHTVWDEIVDRHVATMVESQRLSDPEMLLNMDDEEFYMRLRERVVPRSVLRPIDEFSYSRPLVDAHDSPRRVLNLSFPDLALSLAGRYLVNRDLATAWAFGRENTAAVPIDQRESLVKDGIVVEALRGDSIYVASKVADMPALIEKYSAPAEFGVLFAIPNAYEIDFYPVENSEDTVRAAELMATLAHMLVSDTPSPASPEVFFWRGGQFCQVTNRGEVRPNGVFASTLAELASL